MSSLQNFQNMYLALEISNVNGLLQRKTNTYEFLLPLFRIQHLYVHSSAQETRI